MSKSDTNNLRQNASTASGLSSNYANNANQTYAQLTPTLNRLAAGGGGYTPQQIGNMDTAALQATGGANAGVVGSAMQRAAATNNAGGANALALAAGHDATQNLSDAALGVQNRSADLAAQQQQSALGELGNIYGTSANAGENALGLSTNAYTQANNAANNGFWRGVTGRILNPATYAGLRRR